MLSCYFRDIYIYIYFWLEAFMLETVENYVLGSKHLRVVDDG